MLRFGELAKPKGCSPKSGQASRDTARVIDRPHHGDAFFKATVSGLILSLCQADHAQVTQSITCSRESALFPIQGYAFLCELSRGWEIALRMLYNRKV